MATEPLPPFSDIQFNNNTEKMELTAQQKVQYGSRTVTFNRTAKYSSDGEIPKLKNEMVNEFTRAGNCLQNDYDKSPTFFAVKLHLLDAKATIANRLQTLVNTSQKIYQLVNQVMWALRDVLSNIATQFRGPGPLPPNQILLKKEDFEADKPGAKPSAQQLQRLGSQGLVNGPNGSAISHESLGTDLDKLEKQGRNCDRAFTLDDGVSASIGVFDGSGVSAEALKTAAASAFYAMKGLEEGLFTNANTLPECQAVGLALFEKTIDSTTNPLIADARGYKASGDEVFRIAGATTGMVLS